VARLACVLSDQRRGTRLQRVEPKSASGFRTIGLPAFVADALARHVSAMSSRPRSLVGYIFTTPKGTPLDPRNVSREFDRLLGSSGLPKMRIHDLRHASASLMLSRGHTLEDVKRVLGHATITQTSNTYGHLVEGRSREIADGMDALFGV
jgi:integrase